MASLDAVSQAMELLSLEFKAPDNDEALEQLWVALTPDVTDGELILLATTYLRSGEKFWPKIGQLLALRIDYAVEDYNWLMDLYRSDYNAPSSLPTHPDPARHARIVECLRHLRLGPSGLLSTDRFVRSRHREDFLKIYRAFGAKQGALRLTGGTTTKLLGGE